MDYANVANLARLTLNTHVNCSKPIACAGRCRKHRISQIIGCLLKLVAHGFADARRREFVPSPHDVMPRLTVPRTGVRSGAIVMSYEHLRFMIEFHASDETASVENIAFLMPWHPLRSVGVSFATSKS
jgi:hypothetical protein